MGLQEEKIIKNAGELKVGIDIPLKTVYIDGGARETYTRQGVPKRCSMWYKADGMARCSTSQQIKSVGEKKQKVWFHALELKLQEAKYTCI